jgi:hypothetical protein
MSRLLFVLLSLSLFISNHVRAQRTAPIFISQNIYGKVQIQTPTKFSFTPQLTFSTYNTYTINLDSTSSKNEEPLDSTFELTEYQPNGEIRWATQHKISTYNATDFTYQHHHNLNNLLPEEPSSHSQYPEWIDSKNGTTQRVSYFYSGYVCSNGGYYEERNYRDYVFDENSKLTEMTQGKYKRDSNQTYIPQQTFNYSQKKNKETMEVYTVNAKTMAKSKISQISRIYNSDEKLITELHFSEKLQNPNLKAIQKEITKSELSDQPLFSMLHTQYGVSKAILYSYDNKKLAKVQQLTEYPDRSDQEWTFHYNNLDLLDSVVVSPHYFGYSLKIIYTYDSAGRLIKKYEDSSHGCEGDCSESNATETYEYNEQGKMKSMTYDYASDRLDPFVRYRYNYDL